MICRLCNKDFTALGVHVRLKHGMSAREYKNEFCLPVQEGLVENWLHDKLSKSAKKLMQDDPERKKELTKRIKKYRPKPGYKVDSRYVSKGVAPHKLKKINIENRENFEKKARALIDHIKSGNSPKSYTGFKSKTSITQCRKKIKGFSDEYDKAVESLPYETLKKMSKLSTNHRFIKECKSLYNSGLSHSQIAEKLNVGQNSINRALHS